MTLPYSIEVRQQDDTYIVVGRAYSLARAKRLVGSLITDTIVVTGPEEPECSSQEPSAWSWQSEAATPEAGSGGDTD